MRYSFDEETQVAKVTIKKRGVSATAKAVPSKDERMVSKLVGLGIAEKKAMIKLYRLRENKLKKEIEKTKNYLKYQEDLLKQFQNSKQTWEQNLETYLNSRENFIDRVEKKRKSKNL